MSEESVAAVREAAEGLTRGISREYWLQCAKEKKFPQKLWDAMAETGLLGLTVPEEYGGSGGGLSELMVLNEVTGRAGIISLFFVLGSFARMPIIKHGTPEQITKFVTPTATGEGKMCFGVTEPNAGTNTFRLQTTATKNDSGWQVNGSKVFITGAKDSTSMLLIARPSAFDPAKPRGGLSLFILDSHTPGIEYQRLNIDVLGESQYLVFFKDVQLPQDALIGEEGKGMKYLFDGLNTERLVLASMAVGLGNRALDKAVAYAKERMQFGKALAEFQSMQFKLADMETELQAARVMLYEAAGRLDGKTPDATRWCAMAKRFVTDTAFKVANDALQVHGGYGYLADYGVERIVRDLRVHQILEGTNEIMRVIISRDMLKG